MNKITIIGLGLAVLLTLAVGIGLTSSGVFAGRLTSSAAGLAHAPALTDTPTSTPNPCAPVWSVVSSPNVGINHNLLDGVAVVSANDVWAVGFYVNGSIEQTLVEHWDGGSWSVVSSPNVGTFANVLYGVAAVSA